MGCNKSNSHREVHNNIVLPQKKKTREISNEQPLQPPKRIRTTNPKVSRMKFKDQKEINKNDQEKEKKESITSQAYQEEKRRNN